MVSRGERGVCCDSKCLYWSMIKNYVNAVVLMVSFVIICVLTGCQSKNPMANTKIDINYRDGLRLTKSAYPFAKWRESYADGLEQYTAANCKATQLVFDQLIDDLTAAGRNASEKDKVQFFEKAVLKLNDLNERIDGLIETGEREQLAELIDKITIAAGLDPKNYAEGEGMSDLWREW